MSPGGGDAEGLASRLGHDFADPSLLELALTHRSWCAEHDGTESNERLEFLGDAVLGMAVTDHVFRRFPDAAEGEMAKIRAAVVSATALGQAAERLALGDALRLGRGEHLSGGRRKQSILADAMEAVIGAVYVDGGWPAAQRVVEDLLGERISAAAAGPGVHDYKTRLQELMARRHGRPPLYEVTETGPDHGKRFHATVFVDGSPAGRGEGSSKKQAEQAAAAVAWGELTAVGPDPSS